MYIVGLTGGIGSGKSAAARRFRHHGVTVVNADEIAREVVEPGSEALTAIAEHFGSSVLNDDGSLNRSRLREKIFDQEAQRQWLESLLHPLIASTTDARLQAPPQRDDEPPYRILEAPLLLETNGQHRVRRILLIEAQQSLRLARVIERDDTSEDQVLAIIDAQLSDEEKRHYADDCVDNSSTLEALHRQIDQLHSHYCKLAGQSV